MKKLLIAGVALAGLWNLWAGEARPSYAGRLEFSNLGLAFEPSAFKPGWKGFGASGGYLAEKDGSRNFRMVDSDSAMELGGRLQVQPVGKALHVTYSVTPKTDADLQQLYLAMHLPQAVHAGWTVSVDGKKVVLPSEPGSPHPIPIRTTKTFVLTDTAGKTRLNLAFDNPVRLMVQDNRQWNAQTYSLRIFLGEDKPFKAGKAYAVSFNVSDADETMRLAQDANGVKIVAGKDWIPLTVEPEILPGSALDFTKLRGTEAPAGKYGPVVAKGQDFEFEKLPGVPQRFYGVNVCGTANTPTYEEAQRFARHLAAVGYNAIRFHHHESVLVEKDGLSLNPEQMKRFDGLVAACVANGIYMTTDLFVSRRPVSYRSVGIDRPGNVAMNEYKELVEVHEGVFQNFLQWTRNFLGHVNPYTGRSLAEEPALAWISLINEGNLGNHNMTYMADHPIFAEKWRTWLAARKQADAATYGAIPETLPKDLNNRKSPHVQAYALFLQELETTFARRVRTFLRDEMKCRALLTNLNNWHYPAVYQLPRVQEYDYVDDHFYVDHPHFLEKSWSLPSRCPNTNPIMGEAMGAQGLVMRRTLDKPFTISEYNYSAPGRFRGVGGIACGTAAALQNWAGLWRFAWSHNQQGVAHPDQKPMTYFDMSGDPLGLASERASICLFLRRDLAPLEDTYAVVLPPKKLTEMGYSPFLKTDWTWASWYVKVGNYVADQVPAGTAWSMTYPEGLAVSGAAMREQLFPGQNRTQANMPPAAKGAVTIDGESGRFTLKTPRTSGGFAEGGRIDAGVLQADLGTTPATVWASALDGQPIASAARLLVTHLTDVQNSNVSYADAERRILLAWGGLPHLMRTGRADVSLAVAPGAWKVYALASSGARRFEVPSVCTNGRLAFTADVARDPKNATYLYEVVKE